MRAKRDQFSGAASSLGYLFQARWALLTALRRSATSPSDAVVLEGLDDVEFLDPDGTPLELIQTKHRVHSLADLQDASPALWSTIRVWVWRHTTGAIDISRTSLALVTNGEINTGSAASHLTGSDGRDIDRALALLTSVAQSSKSKTNAAAYSAFLSLSPADRVRLLERIELVPGGPDVLGARKELEETLRFTVRPKHVVPLVDRLEGWWFRKVIESISSAPPEPVALLEIEEQVHHLAEQFARDSLPIDFADLSLDSARADDEKRAFVEQLRLINLGSDRILDAVLDFYKAFHQRSRWLKDGLLLPGELSGYERRLVREWQRYFNMLVEDLDEGAAEEEKVRVGKQVYRWAEFDTSQPIRPECTERYVWRGTYQMMSDQGAVGWHPNFRMRLANLFEEAVS